MDPNNYRGISLLSTSYKVLSKIVQKKLEEYTKVIIEEHQAEFQRGRSTTDHVYILKEVIVKYWEYSKTFYGLFVDLSKVYDSIYRKKIWEKFGIPDNMLIKLASLSVKESRCKVKIDNKFSEKFEIKTGVRRGDIISPTLFNVVLEDAWKELEKSNCGIMIGQKKISVMAFADDVVLVSETTEELQEMVDILERETNYVGLKINESKTKLVRFGRGGNNIIEDLNNQYEQVDSFKYLGITVN